MTITINVSPELEMPLQQAARLEGKDVVSFLLASLQQQLRRDVLPEVEAKLLQTINAPIAPTARRERDALLTVQTQRELTETERNHLDNLIDTVEIANAERWRCIAELAARRGLSLPEIARDLEIPLA